MCYRLWPRAVVAVAVLDILLVDNPIKTLLETMAPTTVVLAKTKVAMVVLVAVAVVAITVVLVELLLMPVVETKEHTQEKTVLH